MPTPRRGQRRRAARGARATAGIAACQMADAGCMVAKVPRRVHLKEVSAAEWPSGNTAAAQPRMQSEGKRPNQWGS
jgi:hypothetical protein